ncbi:MAG: hypothetical protein CVU62_10680 [Deltaproteobacteria bacterium HGW-Deltaproteobacteria-2]|jgi:hypothetical protein|nr:MAG: hypothetical protein CVU62_10680 [Deltaproteobacteria bacterium HGW-Deltaproteobacteria-2]
MSFWLKINWAIWTTLVVIVVTGGLANYFSSTKRVALELRPNASVVVSVFRPFSDKLRLLLVFKGSKRPELGEWGTTKESGEYFLEFPKPGVPIKLLIRGKSKATIYEALPVSGYSGDNAFRDLYPFVDDGKPNIVPWPPDLALMQNIPVGISTLNISVLEVGKQLVGERVILVIKEPIDLKFIPASLGYKILWWFIFWPLYASLLFVYGIALLWKSISIIATKRGTLGRSEK